jgi:uncharacterized membrane protein YczE
VKFIFLFLAIFALSPPVFAYIDPGTGMLAIQGLIALVVGLMAFVRNPLQVIRRIWRRWIKKDQDDA